jgi:hypothetical protein
VKRTSRKPKTSRKPRTSRARHEHVVDNQGLCHVCGKMMNRDWWEAYAGRGATAPSLRRNGNEIGQTVLDQMGGTGRIRAMIGAKDFVALPDGVQFGFPGRRETGNKLVVKLEPSDTYRMEFWWVRGAKAELLRELEGIYADQLADLFYRQTGLRLSLGTMGRNRPRRRSRR